MKPRDLRLTSPYTKACVPWFFFVFATGMILGSAFHLPVILSLFIGLNAGAFLLYGLDKMAATAGRERVPEKILWLSALLGGSVGALCGMYAFRHKTKKGSFQFVIALIVLIQIAIILWYLKSNTPFIDDGLLLFSGKEAGR